MRTILFSLLITAPAFAANYTATIVKGDTLQVTCKDGTQPGIQATNGTVATVVCQRACVAQWNGGSMGPYYMEVFSGSQRVAHAGPGLGQQTILQDSEIVIADLLRRGYCDLVTRVGFPQ